MEGPRDLRISQISSQLCGCTNTRGHPSWERLCSFDQILSGAKTPEGCSCPAPPLPAEGEARARTVETQIFFLRISISEIYLISHRQRVPLRRLTPPQPSHVPAGTGPSLLPGVLSAFA